MNREIKFRAWDTFNNEMLFQNKLNGMFIGTGAYNLATVCNYGNGIIPMEFTGLKDKNNKEVYDGDWCKAKFRTVTKVLEIEGLIIMDEFMWCIKCEDDTYSINRIHDVEIMTNIYENPELLNQTKN